MILFMGEALPITFNFCGAVIPKIDPRCYSGESKENHSQP